MLATVLANRPTHRPPDQRFRTVAEAGAFLRCELPELDGRPHDPFLLDDMDRAVTRLREAIQRGERICIYGDYDVDGLTATALLDHALKRAGGTRVDHYIPDRIQEGYGLSGAALRKLREERKVDLVVTVDCGVTAVDEADLARSLGLGLIITDHHEPGPRLPRADAVVNPRRPGSGYPFPDLAGVGVALKLVQALAQAGAKARAHDQTWAAPTEWGPTQSCSGERGRARKRTTGGAPLFDRPWFSEASAAPGTSSRGSGGEEDFWSDLLDLVALGTVADIVPLVGENRYLVRRGLDLLNPPRRPGLLALGQVAGLEGKTMTTYHLGFQLGPRLNAAGRLGDAGRALRLLLTEDAGEAVDLAQDLDRGNRERQAFEERVFSEAVARIEQGREIDLEAERAIVLAGEGWHEGVIGIVASRLVERYARPALLVAVNSGLGRGSGRSIPAFNLVGALDECAAWLERYGGHHMAAGFELESDAIAPFARRFLDLARECLPREDLVHELRIDAWVEPGDLAGFDRFVGELDRLEPYGAGNPEPVLAMSGVRFSSVRTVGEEGRHLKALVKAGDRVLGAIGFGLGHLAGELALTQGLYDIAFRPCLDNWQGQTRVELKLVDLRPAGHGLPAAGV